MLREMDNEPTAEHRITEKSNDTSKAKNQQMTEVTAREPMEKK